MYNFNGSLHNLEGAYMVCIDSVMISNDKNLFLLVFELVSIEHIGCPFVIATKNKYISFSLVLEFHIKTWSFHTLCKGF